MICEMCKQEFHGYNKYRRFCDECRCKRKRARARRYYWGHHEKELNRKRQYRATNKEAVRASNKKYAAAHREEINLKKKVKRITGEYRLPRV